MYLKPDSSGKVVKVCDEFIGDTMFESKNRLVLNFGYSNIIKLLVEISVLKHAM